MTLHNASQRLATIHDVSQRRLLPLQRLYYMNPTSAGADSVGHLFISIYYKLSAFYHQHFFFLFFIWGFVIIFLLLGLARIRLDLQGPSGIISKFWEILKFERFVIKETTIHSLKNCLNNRNYFEPSYITILVF